jgi:tetratricopeptide (TPR) repeat protein
MLRISLILWAALSTPFAQTEAPRLPDKATASPSQASEAVAKAEQLYRTGQFYAAEREYQSIIQADPGAARAYAGLARVYLKQKKTAEAYSAAAKAGELAPKLDSVRVVLAEVHFRQGKFDQAAREFIALSGADSKEARAFLGLSRIYEATSNYKHAKLAIDRAHELDPDDPEIRKEWIGTLSLQERVKALKAYLGIKTNDDDESRQALEERVAILEHEQANRTRPCRLKTKPAATEMKLERLLSDPGHIRAYGLSVKVNDASSKLLLDTGASGILINTKVADRSKVTRLLQTELKGIGDKGPASGYVGFAESIKVGQLEFQDCYVRVIDKRSVVGEEGLIGADVFDAFLVDIDFPNEKLKLSELPARPGEAAGKDSTTPGSSDAARLYDRYIAPEMKGFTPVVRFGSHLLIQTTINDAGPKLFLIDTGGFNNMINPAAAREVTKVSSDSDLIIKGVSGSVKNVFRADQVTLQFSHLRQKNQDIVAFDTMSISDSLGMELSGILGFAMLRMLEIKIDYRDGLVDFVYDTNRWR